MSSEIETAFREAAQTRYGPYKADMGTHALLDHDGELLLWFVLDAEKTPFAWFYHEEDAVAFAAISNAALLADPANHVSPGRETG